MTNKDDLVAWLRVKIADAKKAVKSREQAEEIFRSGDDESWRIAAQIHPSTRGKPMNRAERLEVAEREKRIAFKCRNELEMFESLLALVGGKENDEG